MFSKSLIKRARIQVLIQKNRREAIVRQSRDDIAQLLICGQLDDALARVDRLHNDQCVLSAYDQIENFCDCVYTNLRSLDRKSKLSEEVSEAVSSLVFAASRCGELSELHRMRVLFKKYFGDEFERSVELLPGNFVNSQIAVENEGYVLENWVEIFDPQFQGFGGLGFKAHDGSSNRSRSEGSPPIKETDIKNLDNVEDRSSTNGEDFRGKHKANGSQSLNRSLSSKRFVKKNLSQRSAAMIKKDAVRRKHDGLLHESRRNHQNMLSREDLSMRDSNSERRHVTSSFSDKKKEDVKPRLSYVHPKLPDYDELVTTFTEYKKEYMKSNSSNRNLRKWMRQ
ncbi:hypothetical protein Acr_17g0004170 [Actinidia rufa]|uniref:Regulator of Vps4 activity in the MVB pathway protein n=1 Tax=Actinidia rufa TaxID=165716 RepID=A0A7J0G239_9ERIC|nr:hypothetical protein Acr_17g0004170 [Actinidia rufa]